MDTKKKREFLVIFLQFDKQVLLVYFATLAKTNTPNDLLEQVAAQINMLEKPDQRGNLAACVEVLAGLRFEESLIRQFLREEIMQESVTYQAIIPKGVQQGLQQGKQQGKQEEARSLIMRLLARRFGAVDQQMQERIQQLSVAQLEELGEALLDFTAASDLAVWFDEHQSINHN